MRPSSNGVASATSVGLVNTPTLTSIEQVFHYELFCLKISGALLFKGPKLACVAYRLLMLICGRFVLLSQAPSRLKVLMASSSVNAIFFVSFFFISNVILITNLYTELKYRRLLNAILSKRFDVAYLNKVSGPKKDRAAKAEADMGSRVNVAGDVRAPSKIQAARKYIIFSALFFMLTRVYEAQQLSSYPPLIHMTDRYLWRNLQALGLRLGLVQVQSDHNDTLNGSLLNLELIQPANTTIPLLEHGAETDEVQGNRLPDLLFGTVWAAFIMIQTYAHGFLVLMIASSLNDMIRFAAESDGFSMDTRKKIVGMPTLATAAAAALVEDTSASIPSVTSQQSYQVSTKARTLYSEGTEATKSDQIYALPSRRHSETNSYGQRRASTRGLLTRNVLLHVRDILLVLRKIMSLNYLNLLIVELCLLITMFFYLNNAFSNTKIFSASKILLSLMNYSTAILLMVAARLGHHWLHQEASRLQKSLEDARTKSNLSKDELSEKYSDNPHSKTITNPLEDIIILRLTDSILKLWPSGWFAPDLKSVFRQNVIVVTFVTTLQQLVDASNKSRTWY